VSLLNSHAEILEVIRLLGSEYFILLQHQGFRSKSSHFNRITSNTIHFYSTKPMLPPYERGNLSRPLPKS